MREGAVVPEGALARALADQEERLSHCVHCGFCLPACPTYVRLGDEADSPRGRLYLMRAVAEGRLDPGSGAFQLHIDRCLGCRACEPVCPSGVEYGLILERAREVAVEARRPPVSERLLLEAVRRPWLFRVWMGASRALRATGLPALLARILPGRGAVGQARLAMAMLAASAPARLPAGRKNGTGPAGSRPGDGAASRPTPRGRVALLRGCIQDHLFRRVNEATRRVLEANGWEVVNAPGQGCCGALHAHGGRLDEARAMARRNVGAFRGAEVDFVAVNAAGCGAAMREYEHLPDAGDGEERYGSSWLSERVRDVSELLAGEGRVLRRGAPLPLEVAYDPPCHLLHAQGVSDPPLRMLEAIPELETLPVERAEECCGGAGIYGVTHPDLGSRIGLDKVRAVEASGAAVLATGNPGCMMQIGAGIRILGVDVAVVHPVELLDASYRLAGMYDEEDDASRRSR